jgi:peptide/nickel transport system ATP-binding protein
MSEPASDSSTPSAPLLEIADLDVTYRVAGGRIDAVQRASLTVAEGEVVAVVGESGSGKSTLAQAVIGLLPANGAVAGGSVRLGGRELTGLSEKALREVRGPGIGLVPQDPTVSLNPVHKIGRQVGEALRVHGLADRRGAAVRAVELLAKAGLPDPEVRAGQYPHELSGGMRQRVSLARALASATSSDEPSLLLMDEPFAALDAITRDMLQGELLRVWEATGTTILFVTHDVREAVRLAQRVVLLSSRPGTVVREWDVPEDGRERLHDEITARLREVITSHAA